MKIYKNSVFVSDLKDGYIFFDTSALIATLNFETIYKEILVELKKNDCIFLSIPAISIEFSRTDSIEGYNKRINFLKSLSLGFYSIEKNISENIFPLNIVLQRINQKIDYTDFLLYFCLFKFRTAFLFTENHSHFSTNLLDRTQILTIDQGNDQIRNMAFYKFSEEKYQKILEKLKSEE